MTNIPWDKRKFFSMMDSTDIDDHINTLDQLLHYLETVKELNFDLDLNRKIISKIMYCLEDPLENTSLPIRVSYCLRVLVLLSTRLPLPNLKDFVYPIVHEAFNKYCMIRSHFVSIIKEILTCLVTSTEQRQQSFIEMMFPLCMNELDPKVCDDINIPLDITTALTESLGSLFNDERHNEIYQKIKSLTEKSKENSAHDIAELAKIWVTYVKPDILQEYINFLLKEIDNYECAFTILSTLIINMPNSFLAHINTLINLLYPKIDILLQGQNEDEEITPQVISDAQNSIASFDVLINAFPETFKETADVYCQLCLDFFSYGVFAPVLSSSGDIEEIEDDFDADGQDEMSDDEVVPNDDDTWKVRKSINFFAQTLIHKYPEIFLTTFYSNPTYLNNTITLIADSDPGAKATSLQTLLLFAKIEKSQLKQETINNWIRAFIGELNSPNQALLLLIYPAFTQLLTDFGNLIPKYSLRIVECIETAHTQTIVPETLGLLNALITTSSNVDELVPSLCKILTNLMNQSNNSQLCFATVSLLYNNASPKVVKPLSDLNTKITDLMLKTGNDSRIYAIEPLSIFVCLFSSLSEAGNSSKQSLETILNFPETNEVYAKISIASISLIASSPSSKILSSKAPEILTLLKKFLDTTDFTLLHRSLWALFICVQNGLFDVKLFDSIVPTIIKLLEIDDSRVRLIAVRVLQKLSASSSLVATSLMPAPLHNLFTTKRLTPQFVIGISEILTQISDDKVMPALEKLIAEGNKLSTSSNSSTLNTDAITSSISQLIGLVCASKSSILNLLLKKFESELAGKTINPFSIRCIGEIGSVVSLKGHQQTVVDRLFDLVLSEDRRTFTAAAHSIGYIAANDTATVFVQLIEKAAKDIGRIQIWLIAISKALRQLKRTKNFSSEQLDLNSLFDFLSAHADFQKETETIFVDCFSSILGIAPSSMLPKFYKNISMYNSSSPLLSRAVADFLCSVESVNEAEPILKQMLPHLNPNNPATCVGSLLSVKNCFKFEGLHRLLSSNFSLVCKCIEVTKNQFESVFYGTAEKTVDLGMMMRITTIDVIASYLAVIPETLDYDLMTQFVTKALSDPNIKVKKRALVFLAKACEYPEALRTILKFTVTAIKNFDMEKEKGSNESISETENVALEIEEPFLQLVAKLHVCTQSSKVAAIERLYVKHSSNKKLKQFEEDASFAGVHFQNKTDYLQSRSICYDLMTKYNQDAAGIFAA